MKRIIMSSVLALIALAAVLLYFFGKPVPPSTRIEPVKTSSIPNPSPGPSSSSTIPEPTPTTQPAPTVPSQGTRSQPEPVPTEPVRTQISQPAPMEPVHTEPAHTEPARNNPQPKEPTPIQPAQAADQAASPAPAAHWTTVEEQILQLTNVERRKVGLQPLIREDGLRESACSQSSDMLARNFFDHVNPSGENPSDRIGRIHRQLIGTSGENIWKGKGYPLVNDPRLAAVIVQAWMNSPHHRANILRPDFTHLGVGVIIQNDEARATQNFSEIKSYLKIPLPQSLPSGSPVAFATSQPAAQMFDLQPVGKTAAQSRPAPIENARLTAPPDTYRIRFFFPETKKGAFAIYDGPQIIVR